MGQIFVEVRNRTFLCTVEICFYNFFWIFPLTFALNSYTCFLVKWLNLPMYVFVLVKSELFKTASYSWAVLTTAACCLQVHLWAFTKFAYCPCEGEKISLVQFIRCFTFFLFVVYCHFPRVKRHLWRPVKKLMQHFRLSRKQIKTWPTLD